jgi:hypothetical protein
LTSRLAKLHGGLMLWVMMSHDEKPDAEVTPIDRIHAAA